MIQKYPEHQDHQQHRLHAHPDPLAPVDAAVGAGAAERPSKHQMIEAICRRNRSARPEFLQSFDEPTLASYLQRLTRLTDHRGRESVWVRQGTSRSVVTRLSH